MRRRRYYDCLSRFYGIAECFEKRYKDIALDTAGISGSLRVLDLGCGRGCVMAELSRRGHAGVVAGVDFSRKMVGVAHDSVGVRTVCVGDCRAIPFSDGSFDVVFSSYVLDLMDGSGREGMISEVWRVLGSGGKLVMVNNARGSGLYRVMSGFYMVLRLMLPGLMIDEPIDSRIVFHGSEMFSIEAIRVLGFTEIAVLGKKSYI